MTSVCYAMRTKNFAVSLTEANRMVLHNVLQFSLLKAYNGNKKDDPLS